MNILNGANRYRAKQAIEELDTVLGGTTVTRLAYAENPGNDSTWRPSPAIRRHTLPAGAIVTIVASAQTAAIDAYFELANTATGGTLMFTLEEFPDQPNDITYLDVAYVPLNSTAIVLRNGDNDPNNGGYNGGIPYTLSGGRFTFAAGNPPSSGLDRYDILYYPSTTAWVPPQNDGFPYTFPITFSS